MSREERGGARQRGRERSGSGAADLGEEWMGEMQWGGRGEEEGVVEGEGGRKQKRKIQVCRNTGQEGNPSRRSIERHPRCSREGSRARMGVREGRRAGGMGQSGEKGAALPRGGEMCTGRKVGEKASGL